MYNFNIYIGEGTHKKSEGRCRVGYWSRWGKKLKLKYGDRDVHGHRNRDSEGYRWKYEVENRGVDEGIDVGKGRDIEKG